MLGDELHTLLVSVPDPGISVNELFRTAKQESEQQFFLSLLDFARFGVNGTSFLLNDPQPRWVLQQFLKYFRAVVGLSADTLGEGNEDLVMRLQMLAYAQFWEAFAVKRIFSSLLTTCEGKQYEVRTFRGFMRCEEQGTYEFYTGLREKAHSMDLAIAEVLSALYKNQIRNAFAHSQFCIIADYITFTNCESDKPWSIPSLKLGTWNRLFELTKDLILALFRAWDEGLGELHKRIPYEVKIAGCSYLLGIDDRDGTVKLVGTV